MRGTTQALTATLALILALGAILLARDPGYFWHCDFQLWFTGVYEDTARAWLHGEWPILSPNSWTTGNLAGEYQCGTFSVFHNAAVVVIYGLLPLSLGGKAAAIALLHLCVLAAGTVLLVRQRGHSPGAATLAGVYAACNGWIITWAASQWFVALAGFAWVPWCWWAFENATTTSSFRVRWLLPAPFVYLCISAGSPFADLMLGVIGAWLIVKEACIQRRFSAIAPLLFSTAAGIALAAPAWLALIEYHRFSMRAEWGFAPQWAWVVPWRAWLALVLPSFTTPWRDFYGVADAHYGIELAGGLIPLAIVLSALTRDARETWRRCRWELALLAIAIVLVSVPMFGSFRWSFRNLPLFHLTLALLAAQCLDRVNPLSPPAPALVLLALAAVVGGTAHWLYAVVCAVILLAWMLVNLFARTRDARLAWLWPSLAATELLLATYWTLPTTQKAFVHPFAENLRSPAPLDSRRLYLSLWAFDDLFTGMSAPAGWGTAIRPGNTPLAADLHFLNGYSSFGARGVPALFEVFGSVKRDFAASFVSSDSDSLLELLGVDGLILSPTYAELSARLKPEWRLAHESDEGRVYHREPARAAPAKALAFLDDQPGVQHALPFLTVLESHRRSITLGLKPNPASEPPVEGAEDIGLEAESTTSRPVAIAFARPYFPGYVASLNGHPFPVRAYADLVPLVELPPGASGTLELVYEPMFLRVGLTVFLGAIAALEAVFLLGGKRSG